MPNSSRREFLKSSLTAAGAGSLSTCLPASALSAATTSPRELFFVPADSATLPIKKGVLLEMLPEKLSYVDGFKLRATWASTSCRLPPLPMNASPKKSRRPPMPRPFGSIP